jgi:uncharacterized protein YdhG (YjbR/CyaY superfamily)
MAVKKTPTGSTKRATDRTAKNQTWTDEEVAAMQEHVKEMKRAKAGADGAAELRAKIAELPEPDRGMAERIHAVVTASAPVLTPRTYYGMPAWAKDGKVLCFFTPAAKFKERYATFGFNADANLDEGSMLPTSWALTTLSPAEEARIAELVKKAVSR